MHLNVMLKSLSLKISLVLNVIPAVNIYRIHFLDNHQAKLTLGIIHVGTPENESNGTQFMNGPL